MDDFNSGKSAGLPRLDVCDVLAEPEVTVDEADGLTAVHARGCDVYATLSVDRAHAATIEFGVAPRCTCHARQRVAQVIMERPELEGATHLVAAIPLGDFELLTTVRAALPDSHVHAAGCTCLLEATLIPSQPQP